MRFEKEALATRARIKRRLDSYVAMLRGAAGFFATSAHLDRAEYRRYVSQLDLQGQYPGILGIGFSRRIAAYEVDSVIAAERESGAPDFHIWPEGKREEYHSTVLLEPLDRRNRAAIGYDMSTEPDCRRAMESARESGQPAVSRKVTLVQEIDDRKQAGFVIYVPVYLTEGLPGSVETRRALLVGFSYAPFRADDLFGGIFASAANAVPFQVYDGSRGAPLLSADPGRGKMEMELPLDLAGSTWTLRFVAPPEFSAHGAAVPAVLTCGTLASLLLFLFLRAQGRANADAAQSSELRRSLEAQAQAERALRASEQRYRQLFEDSPLPSWVYDAQTLAFLDVNGAALAHYGWSREEFLGMSIFDLHPPDQVPQLPAPAGSAPQRGAHRRKDGTIINVEVSSHALVRDGMPARLVVAHDVTAREEAEAARRKAEREALEMEAENCRIQEASRLKSKFLANMSHELRTPLNAIMGFSEMLRDGEVGPVSSEQGECLDHVLVSSRHLLKLISDILDMAKVEAGKLEFHAEPLELRVIISEIIATLRAPLAGKELRVQMDVEPGLGMVIADEVRLKQVLYNYLSNAIKFSPVGAELMVRALPEGEAEFRLEVEDRGAGIEPHDLQRLFVDFQQLDSGHSKNHGGTGLGLALTKRLVEAQGGRVGVRSTVGSGSAFHAILPRQPRKPAKEKECLAN